LPSGVLVTTKPTTTPHLSTPKSHPMLIM
jgi:hypothetical protein